ncbi:MAG: hypothetical protein A2Y67_01470 [Candidatus Buchananbacteria bacterium RBG_13_39_9]|uniref:Uncharacterized protein n=1 Tax=Candidatus Buchananbacteria bacterium RBG_13_39_9 TaxID=1797531 RepID=A0A1G1XRZ3_9BACT|nr:MAG: hypothetical protein A2Y67_01470 [Candidatus Buchananbacteria bacterium RBG_13_39_9]
MPFIFFPGMTDTPKEEKENAKRNLKVSRVILLIVLLSLAFPIFHHVLAPNLDEGKVADGVVISAPKSLGGVINIVPATADAPEFVEGVVAEAPIPLGGGICLVGVSVDDFHDGRDIRAALVSADRSLVIGQKVKVKIRLVSESYRPALDLLVIQDDAPK